MPASIAINSRIRIIELNSQGFSAADIVSELELNVSTVHRWLRRYRVTGNINSNYGQCGRSSSISDDIRELICLKSIEDPFRSAAKIIDELELDISIWAVNGILREAGLWTRHAATKPKLEASHRRRRIEFSTFYRGNIDWTQANSDECCFSSEKDGIKLVKRPINTRFDPAYLNQSDHCSRKTVSVWGFASYHGLGPLIKLDSRLNGSTYLELLDTVAVEFIKSKFNNTPCFWLEDNCPAHNCRLVNEWFSCCNALHGINCQLIRLPAYSPDINIIENIWGMAKYSMLYSKCCIGTREELAVLIDSEWAKLSDLSICNTLINSIDDRLDAIIRANGYPIKY